MFAVAAVLFGGTFVAAKAGLAHLPPLLFVAIRFDIGAIVLAGYAAFALSREELRPRTIGDAVGIAATGLLVIGLTNALLFVGQQYTTSGVAAIVFSLNPILTPVFAALLLADERLSVRGGIGTGLGLLGVVLVASPGADGLLAGGPGVLILLGGAVASALGAVLIRRADANLSSTARTVWGVPLAAVLTHLFSYGAGESVSSVSVTPTAVLALAYVGVFSGAIAYLAYFALIDAGGATRANLIFYVIPIVSALGGWLLLGESISRATVLGFAVIIAGFAIIGSRAIGRVIRDRRDGSGEPREEPPAPECPAD
ncbi:EamA family transporter [Halobacteriales archaeon QH_10_67_13]|nr:MAG: EamA family transporter [Halobacteriales archaeon QH_10_67_13]